MSHRIPQIQACPEMWVLQMTCMNAERVLLLRSNDLMTSSFFNKESAFASQRNVMQEVSAFQKSTVCSKGTSAKAGRQCEDQTCEKPGATAMDTKRK